MKKGKCIEHVSYNIDPHRRGPVPIQYHSVNKGNWRENMRWNSIVVGSLASIHDQRNTQRGTKTWIAGSRRLKHINGWSKIRGGGSHKNQNGMLSSACSGKKVIHKMNDETKTRGYLSKKGGHASQRERTGAVLWGPEHPSPSPPMRCAATGGGPGAGRVETSIAAGSGGRGHKRGHRRRSARAPAVSTGERVRGKLFSGFANTKESWINWSAILNK
jgi:hypothetical protein